jgi:hypothetical protein
MHRKLHLVVCPQRMSTCWIIAESPPTTDAVSTGIADKLDLSLVPAHALLFERQAPGAQPV